MVDFEFNGGNRDASQPQLNGKGYIFNDDTSALNQVAIHWQGVSTPDTIRLVPNVRNSYVLSTYVAPEFVGFDLSDNATKNLLIYTGSTARARIKYSVEDYNYTRVPTGGATKWAQTTQLFRFSDYVGQCVSQNIQWVSAHNYFNIASALGTEYAYGKLGGGGVCLGVNIENMIEWNELYNGYGVTDADQFLLRAGSCSQSGTTTGTGVDTEDVDKFGFLAFTGLADFQGPQAMGTAGGASSGSTYYVFDDCTFNIIPTSDYGSYNVTFDCKFTPDYTGIWDTGDDQDPSTKTELPSHALEIVPKLGDGNFWIPRFQGGNNRTTIYQIDTFTFAANTNRNNYITDYYCNFYFPTNSKITRTEGMDNGYQTISSTKAVVAWEIPRVGDVRQISRNYLIGNSYTDLTTTFSTVGLPIRNAIRTMSNWCTILNKYVDDFTQAEKDYIYEYGRPIELQVEDEFKICSWIIVNDATGLSKGDSVTGDTSGATATVERVEQVRYTNRVVLKGASASFDGDASINGGAYTITSSSNYDPTEVYKCMRKQRGDFASSTLSTTVDFNGDEWTHNPAGDYATGVNLNSDKKSARQAYQWSYMMLDKNLPDGVNGVGAIADKDDPTLYIEIVVSKAEYLLDGQTRRGRLKYIGTAKYSNNYVLNNEFNRTTSGGSGSTPSGYGLALNGTSDNNIISFDSESWLTALGGGNWQVAYTRAEMSWYLRSPSNWQRTAYRQNKLASEGNTSQMRPAGKTAFNLNSLAKYSKGYTLINVDGIKRILETEKGSSQGQFDNTQVIYDENPSYVPQYAIDEEMLPPTESAPYVPKIRLYGQRTIDFINTELNEYGNTTGNTVLTDADVNNAPDLPKTIRDILATLPS